MKRILNVKEPVKVRSRKLSNGCHSLYLDIYLNGERRYEFLKLYLVPEHSPEDRKQNREMFRLANAVKSRRIIELQNRSYGFHNVHPSAMKLTEYIAHLQEEYAGKRTKSKTLAALKKHLERYSPLDVALSKVDKAYIEGFMEYLKTARQVHSRAYKLLHANTRHHYFKVLGYCLNRAVAEEYLPGNPMDKIKSEDMPRRLATQREYLTMEELKRLIRTPFSNRLLKQAFLFSCFCGLRHCDIVALTWDNIRFLSDGEACLNIVQQKTHEAITLPLSLEALKQLPERGLSDGKERIFKGLISLGRTNNILHLWAGKAGIDKHITFHSARHTHATMMLTLGADLYTVSKLLGHTSIRTTQIYAKIVDERKRKAIELIPDMS